MTRAEKRKRCQNSWKSFDEILTSWGKISMRRPKFWFLWSKVRRFLSGESNRIRSKKSGESWGMHKSSVRCFSNAGLIHWRCSSLIMTLGSRARSRRLSRFKRHLDLWQPATMSCLIRLVILVISASAGSLPSADFSSTPKSRCRRVVWLLIMNEAIKLVSPLNRHEGMESVSRLLISLILRDAVMYEYRS